MQGKHGSVISAAIVRLFTLCVEVHKYCVDISQV